MNNIKKKKTTVTDNLQKQETIVKDNFPKKESIIINNSKKEETIDNLKKKNIENNIKNNSQTLLQNKIKLLNEKINIHKAESQKNWELFLRSQAEIENIKKNNIKEYKKIKDYALNDFSKELLNIIDNIEQGLKITNNKKDIQSLQQFKDGMFLVYKLLINIFNKFNIKKIDCLNQSFDPSLHEAISIQKKEKIKSNIIIEVLQEGYKYKDKVLRHAKVVVSQ